jgi:hypothetical protein
MAGVSKRTRTVRRTSVSDITKMMSNTGIKTEDEELRDFLAFLKKDKAKSPVKMSIDKKSPSPTRKKDVMNILDKAWDNYEFSQMSSAFKKQKL